MELKEIKQKICELRCEVEELSEECFSLWKDTFDINTENVANYLHYELTDIATRLSDLEDTDDDSDTHPDTEDDALETLDDWWGEQDTMQKCELANVPYPTEEDGRGENLMEAEDRADRWWNSRTLEQKQEIHEEHSAWWDNE